MITYSEVKNSPHGWMDAMPNANEPMKDINLAMTELVDSYRGKMAKEDVLNALQTQRDRVDEDWPEIGGPKSADEEEDPTEAA